MDKRQNKLLPLCCNDTSALSRSENFFFSFSSFKSSLLLRILFFSIFVIGIANFFLNVKDENSFKNIPISTSISEIPLDVFFAISSAPHYFERRMATRKSWLRYKTSLRYSYKFFIGQNYSVSIRKKLEVEQTLFDDIIFLAINEDYHTGAEKTMALMEWSYNNVNFIWFLKVDDDSFIRLDILDTYLVNFTSTNLFAGRLNSMWAPHREGKWYISPSEWPNKYYGVIWANGWCYWLSRDLVEKISKYVSGKSKHGAMVWLEDVNTGLVLQNLTQPGQLNFRDLSDTIRGYPLLDSNGNLDPQMDSKWCIHSLSPQQLFEAFNKFGTVQNK